MSNREWFKNAKFGMMIHWGLYSILGGEWRGQRIKNIGEWIMHSCEIPISEYEQLAGVFNPICFNAEEWVKLAHDAGMQYIVITSKHHEGFCLFKSEVDSYNSVDATPFGRDIIAELAESMISSLGCIIPSALIGMRSTAADTRRPSIMKTSTRTVIGAIRGIFPSTAKRITGDALKERSSLSSRSS